ncbi:MAG: RagB/SusD family nutrient uptake outer membrane protein [Bacteroidales bacterium]
MKKLINIFLGAAFFALFTVSCEVERFPYDQIEQTQAFQTMTDAENINNGLYAQLRNSVYGIFMFSTDVQADLFNASLDFGNRNGFPHRWEGFLSTDYTIRDTWQLYYSAMVNINNVLDNMQLIETANAEEEAIIEGYIGEAYLLRAFYYHQLVIRWGIPYDAATASTDLGVPLVLTYDPTAKPARATVQQTYDQILDDITEAKARLSEGAPNATKLNRDAALALEARVYLHMENYPAAITAANELIGSGRYPLITTAVDLSNMWTVNDNGSEIIMHVQSSAPSELPGSLNNIYLGFQPATEYYTPDFIPMQWVVDLYEEDDIRREIYLQEKPLRVQGVDYDTGILLLNKYPGNPELFTGSNTNYQHKPIVFRIAETYLNLAEAQFYEDPGAALTTLNTLRVARGLVGLDGLSGDALFEAIKEERTRELLAEGMRLNDLMRWGMPVDRASETPQNTGPINRGELYDGLFIPVDHPKFIWGIPSNDMTTNPNLIQNDGW